GSLHRPPSSLLLPYPTLFRSHHGDAVRADASRKQISEASDEGRRLPAAGRRDDLGGAIRQRRGRSLLGVECGEQAGDAMVISMRDRKSTRLNSSHQIISYAVF